MPARHVRVRDCMHAGIVSRSPDTSLVEVARLMADHRVHAIAIADAGHSRPRAIVSDLDVVAAVSSGQQVTAAARVMTERAVGHLVVVDPASGYRVGILSTLDVASAYGGQPA